MTKYQIKFSDWWGKESALLDTSCFLYKLKDKLIKMLLVNDIITLSDLDDRNKTPHVRVTDKKISPKDQSAYDKINNKELVFTLNDIHFYNDWIDLDLGHSGQVDTHFTLVYKKGIINSKDKILDIVSKLLPTL